MSQRINDFSINVATVNGSGSQSANNILMRSIFRMGIPVEGKNIFPSNIAGLPTWFSIRVNHQGFTSRQQKSDIFVAMNKSTAAEDILKVKSGGIFIYNSGLKIEPPEAPEGVQVLAVDFNKLAGEVTKSIQLKKLLVNMTYVGLLAELLKIPEDVISSVIEHQFKGKESVFKINREAIDKGMNYARENIEPKQWNYKVEALEKNKNRLLIDGNTAAALGFLFGGCTFSSWYPITPSSSLAESFEDYSKKYRVDEKGQNQFAMVQAEDELSAISMVAGAGWAGARAMTTTSGPGISLMAECIGLMYFAEIPGVIWDVQRMGPSTGLPTRTSQGDVLSVARLSHGDTRHPIYFPSSPKECFEFATQAMNLSEKLQTPVFVLSDLDLGMNFWLSDNFKYPQLPLDRGKVLKEEDLKNMDEFSRYLDVDGDGVPYRTLPGTKGDLASYFTRGTGHTPTSAYSEDSENYQELLNRIDKKWETAKLFVPSPEVQWSEGAKNGILYFGSTQSVISELKFELGKQKTIVNTMRIKAYPFHFEVQDFLFRNEKIFIIEQNQQGQMAELLKSEFPNEAHKFVSLCSCDGMPLCVSEIQHKFSGEFTCV